MPQMLGRPSSLSKPYIDRVLEHVSRHSSTGSARVHSFCGAERSVTCITEPGISFPETCCILVQRGLEKSH